MFWGVGGCKALVTRLAPFSKGRRPLAGVHGCGLCRMRMLDVIMGP